MATAGTAVNFTLIARPMAEMVGGTNFIGAYRTADIAALVIIMVEISMGLFLMESLRITRLFPVIGALSDKIRVRMVIITFLILLLMASIEAGLAYMREVLLLDEMATNALLRGDNSGSLVNTHLWITTAAQMGMGFVLPFALVFVAIPLETFVHSLRTVVGLIGIAVLQALALVLRLLGTEPAFLGQNLERLPDIAEIDHAAAARRQDVGGENLQCRVAGLDRLGELTGKFRRRLGMQHDVVGEVAGAFADEILVARLDGLACRGAVAPIGKIDERGGAAVQRRTTDLLRPGRNKRRAIGFDPHMMQMHVRVDAARHHNMSLSLDDAHSGFGR